MREVFFYFEGEGCFTKKVRICEKAFKVPLGRQIKSAL